jgi:hypothetical protein
MIVVVSSLAGALSFAYWYATDSAHVARLVRTVVPRFLPGGVIDLGKAQWHPLRGEFELRNLLLKQTIDGASFQTLRIPYLKLRHDAKAMMEGRFEPSDVVVTHPTLRICRRKDGTWNLQGLLASPWPAVGMKTPPIVIQNGTVELVNADAAPGAQSSAVLRDVSLTVKSAGPGRLEFDGLARGDSFDRLGLRGTLDIATGRLELSGDVALLAIADPLRSKLPDEVRPALDRLGLTGGECDVRVNHLVIDPSAPAGQQIRYDVSGHLRSGVLDCKKLPFPINRLTARFSVCDGLFTLAQAEGFYGTTSVRVDAARLTLGCDPAHDPFALEMEIVDLELDDKLRAWTPPEFAILWTEFQPRGRVSVAVSAGRDTAGGPLRKKVVVDCDDVAILYKYFKYPVDHVRGRLIWEGDRVNVVGMRTLVGGRPVTALGTINHPGLSSLVSLTFSGEALPVDKTLIDALPPDVRKVVVDFNPRGSVRGTVSVRRSPPLRPGDDPIGLVAIDADLDLNEGCGITWVGMPYPVNNLTGRLVFHPDVWEFQNMQGQHDQALITGSGKVVKLAGPGDRLNVDLNLTAKKLPFDEQLRAALPPAWKKSWEYLMPTGSSDVDATIRVHDREPDSYHLVITPRPATGIRLSYSRLPTPVDRGGKFELRLEDVTGRFVFNNGTVDMTDAGFSFHGAPVQFARGRVIVKDNGQFALGVSDLWVRDIRLDTRVRSIMPPVMEQFAQKLDDGRSFTLKGNLGLDWSGVPGASVRCRWSNVLVVFIDNSVRLQPEVRLDHLQGQLDHVWGQADGQSLEVHGALRLESMSLLGQQIRRLESPLDVDRGSARLDSIRGELLGGKVTGRVSVSLDTTPKYEATLTVTGADLQQYARTLSGHQSYRGLVNARIALNGSGGDLRTIQGDGEAHVVDGDLGQLPVFLRMVNVLQLAPATKTAFDSADVVWTIRNGRTDFHPVRLTGRPFSLMGPGTMDVQGDLDLRLRVLFGRDERLHIGFLSDLVREASGKLWVVRVRGTPAFPQPKLEPLPELKLLGQGREDERR